jgi:HD-GYP domain-containing protein (c-di-GMP phosphodiesterase class II)
MVCDVHDALLSNRVYREAWTREGALGLLREGSGDTLDERCVDAPARIVVSERAPAASAA